MYRKVAFDIGNVLFRVDLDPFLFELEKDIGKEASAYIDSIQAAQDIGLTTMAQALVNRGIARPRAEELSKIWCHTIILSQTTMDFITELNNNKYEIALFSNIGFVHKKFLLENCPELGLCLQHFSCDIGVRKPSILYFQSFFKQHEWWGSPIYFDDKPENFSQIAGKYHPLQAGPRCVQFNLCDYKTNKEGVDILREKIQEEDLRSQRFDIR
jgi:FMN phosphatase YigB (HAD superfamily)